jgi:hypothetical protein
LNLKFWKRRFKDVPYGLKVLLPEECFDVNVTPMDAEGNEGNGVCRRLWIHKKYYPELEKFLDNLHTRQCLDDSVQHTLEPERE